MAALEGLVADVAMAAGRHPRTPAKVADTEAAAAAGKDFEAFFIARMLDQMFAGIRTDGPFGGGHAEAMYRSLMVDEYGKVIARAGGLGLADAIARTLVSAQETASS